MQNTGLKILVRNIALPFREAESEALLCAVRRLNGIVDRADILSCHVYRRSVDARRQNDIRVVRSVLVQTALSPDLKKRNVLSARLASRADAVVLEEAFPRITYGKEQAARPVIVGFGPAGMFAGLLLAQNGYRPLILERGGDTASREESVQRFYKTRKLDPECNVQFGAGGAGTFSDGKLVTRVNDPLCRWVLERFFEFGAPAEVLTEAKPHVGTDRLRQVVQGIADRIEALGGTICYRTRLDSFVCDASGVCSLVTSQGVIPCGPVILAVGHSARDVYRMLKTQGFDVQPKPFSVGVRIEHLQEDIDRGLYGSYAGDPDLPKGEYALSHHVDGRGVYTFCMCPGGEVVAAASEEGGVVVNGMSRYARDGKNACSAVCVSCESDDPMRFQRELEENAYRMAGGDYSAPSQTVGDFLNHTSGTHFTRVQPTYMGGGTALCDLHTLFDRGICRTLEAGIAVFGRRIPGFDAPDAVLTGPETRTSAPYRVKRRENLTSGQCDNLYPCGEGAGYAGGITSAALDGIRCALAVMARYAPQA